MRHEVECQPRFNTKKPRSKIREAFGCGVVGMIGGFYKCFLQGIGWTVTGIEMEQRLQVPGVSSGKE